MSFQSYLENWFSCIRVERSIHPVDSVAPEFSEFVVINSKIRLRCIHIHSDSIKKSRFVDIPNEQLRSNRSSMSEEYWFTKWNKTHKPQRVGSCNCSFRKSLRLSLLAAQEVNVIEKPPVPRVVSQENTGPINIETFVGKLLHNTFLEAFREYYMIETLKKNTSGVINLAFSLNEQNKDLNKYGSEKKSSFTSIMDEVLPEKNRVHSGKGESDFGRCRHDKKLKKPLVFLFHGIGTSAEIWWAVIKSLVNRGYEVVAPDMLGHGYSSAPDKEEYYSFQNLLLHAITIFDNYANSGENRKCILIGHSYGCSFVTALYHHRASYISKLILVSGGGPTPLAPPVKKGELTHSECFQTLIEPLIFCGVNRSLFYPPRGKCFDVCEGYDGAPRHILKFVRMGQCWPGGDAAFHRRIFVPTLLVHGLQDKMVTLVQQCEMERTIPRSFLELIPHAGHMPMMEAPEHLTHMILCFFDCWP